MYVVQYAVSPHKGFVARRQVGLLVCPQIIRDVDQRRYYHGYRPSVLVKYSSGPATRHGW